jgi:ADP-heptose:LPS heptosyltransferase
MQLPSLILTRDVSFSSTLSDGGHWRKKNISSRIWTQQKLFKSATEITQPNKKQVFFFPEAKLNFFHRLSAANYDSVLSFFLARQVLDVILNESSKSTENALIEWLQKATTKYFPKSKYYVVSLIISSVSKTGFVIFLAHLVCLKFEK